MNRKLPQAYTQHDNPTAEHILAADELRPAELTPAELAVWDRIMPYLAMLGRLRPYYVHTLIEYCRVIANINRVEALIVSQGETYESETRNGYQIKMRPEVGQRNELRRMLRSYVNDFGLSPAAEKQLNALQLDMFANTADTNPFLAIQDEAGRSPTTH